MIRPIFLAGVVALAVPAFAQQATNDDISAPAVTEGLASPDAQDRTSAMMAPGQTPTNNAGNSATQGATQSTASHSGMNHGTSAQGTTGTARSTGMTGATGTSGSMTATGTTSGTGAMTNQGVGGPFLAARNYPVCSRTVTDSCIQTSRSPRPRQ